MGEGVLDTFDNAVGGIRQGIVEVEHHCVGHHRFRSLAMRIAEIASSIDRATRRQAAISAHKSVIL
jgi:hypothetical protein